MSAPTDEMRAFQQRELLDAAARYDPSRSSGNALDGDVVAAEPGIGNGTRIAVVVTPLPDEIARVMGGDLLVSVAYPWQRVYAIQSDGDLAWSYVAEKFGPREKYNWGDMYGVAKAIADLTGRRLIGVPGLDD